MDKYPMYLDPSQPEGLYLGLYHGFESDEARESAGDWGERGPMIGPLKYVHTTYATHIKFEFFTEERANLYPIPKRNGVFADFNMGSDCIEFDGMEYGDWTVFYHTKDE